MISDYKFFLVICFGVTSLVGQGTYEEHPDTYLSTEELIQKYGYPVEVHEVTTEDGYMLTMYRIPHGRKGTGVNKKPILLMHGLYGQAENFIVNGMNNGSLAYLLADNGYDVWLGNTRGTQHGKKHTLLNPKQKKFWNFSFHEMGIYDLPAKIDYILKITGKQKLHYVGHSQGGTVFYIMASMRPEYQKKIVLASLLAPGGFERNFNNTFLSPLVTRFKELVACAELDYQLKFGIPRPPALTSFLKKDIDVSRRFSWAESPQDGVVPHGLPMTPCLDLVTDENDFIKCEKEVVGTDESLIRTKPELAETSNLFELPPQQLPMAQLMPLICTRALFREMCLMIMNIALGGDSGEFDKKMIVLLMRFIPSASSKQVLHFAQLINTGHFGPWDYGKEKNMKVYKRELPPDYPVEKITIPTAVYYSKADNLAFAQDIEDICDAIQNCVRKFLMPKKKWNHIDFVIAKNVAKDLYEPLIAFSNKYVND